MKVKARVSFGGVVSMYCGEVRDIPQGAVLDDLLAAGYIEAVEKPKRKAKTGGGPVESE